MNARTTAAAILLGGLAFGTGPARGDDILLVQGTLSVPNAGETNYARAVCVRLHNWLAEAGVPHAVVTDQQIAGGALGGARLAILAYNPYPPAAEMTALARFLDRGGRLLVFHASHPDLAARMHMRLGTYRQESAAGQWSSFRFTERAAPGLPAEVRQSSRGILPVYPAARDARVIAYWHDAAGRRQAEPAWVMSPGGAWMSHVLLDGDPGNKQRLLLALAGVYVPSVWKPAASHALATAAQSGGYGSLDAAVAAIRADAAQSRRALPAGATPDDLRRLAAEQQRLYREGRWFESIEAGRRLSAAIAEAYGRAQRPKAPEFRGMWDHSGTGLYPGDWDRSAQALQAAGMNAILPNMLWAGLAHYNSRILPHSEAYARYGDQLSACLAAARARGMQVHVWKICWNLERAPRPYVDALRRQGRLQVSDAGRTIEWLCPSQPDNVALELAALKEVANYPVDGVQLDYIRFPGPQACFCGACRASFERAIGSRVRSWPAEARRGALAPRFQAWRADQITSFVAAVSREVRRIRPGIAVSAAGYGYYPGCIASMGQDWVRWLASNYVDFVCPMNYFQDLPTFTSYVQKQAAVVNGRGVLYPALGVTARETPLDAVATIRQIRSLRQQGMPGFVLFEYTDTMQREVLPVLALGVTARE